MNRIKIDTLEESRRVLYLEARAKKFFAHLPENVSLAFSGRLLNE